MFQHINASNHQVQRRPTESDKECIVSESNLLNLQNQRIIVWHGPTQGSQELLLRSFGGVETLSQLFEFDCDLLSNDPGIELKQMIGKKVALEIAMSDGDPRYLNGLVTAFAHTGSDGGYAMYRAVLRPWLWVLGKRYDSTIFQDKGPEDITRAVFAKFGTLPDFEFRLRHAPPKPYSYYVQYRESDLNFLSRMWDELGWTRYFEYTKDSHKLVITDDTTQLPELKAQPQIRFHNTQAIQSKDSIVSWAATRELQSGKVTLKSGNYKSPGAPMMTEMDTVAQQGEVERYEIFDYLGQYGFANADEADQIAKRRLERLEAQGKVFNGRSNCRALAVANSFELVGHYDHDAGSAEDRQFLVTSIKHAGSNNYANEEGGGEYWNSFTCIRKKIPHRPPQSASMPMIPGPQTAVVVGPSGEEIYVDAMGRVKVQFKWFRDGESNEKSSCWVRVSQLWASGGFGFIQHPRIGDEVIVAFMDGSPNRPIIVGRVYNGENLPPWDLPANKTQSGILTRSSKGATAANANAFRFEDKKGAEEVWLHAEKDQRLEVEHDESHWVGNDRSKNIDRDETTHVKHDRTETVDNNETITIGVNRTEKVGANETLEVGGNRSEHIAGNHTETINGMENVVIALTATESVGLAKALTVGAGYAVTVAGAMNTAVGLAQFEEVGLNKSVMVGKKFSINAGNEFAIHVGKSSLVMKSNGSIVINGAKLEISGSGPVKINGKDVDIN